MSASVKRQRRVADLLQKEISYCLQFEISDPRIGFVTITDVDVNPDLTVATIHISLLDDSREEEKEVLAGLTSAAPYLKRILGPKLKLRYMPDLLFKIDRSTAYASHIATLLDQIDIPPDTDDEVEIENSDT
ncbi:MAG: 30S ribosome-binding factor RbfA [Chloroflexota bacterium]